MRSIEMNTVFHFIQNNLFWIVPALTIVLTAIAKIAAKSSKTSLSMEDFIDCGYDMMVTAIMLVLTEADSFAACLLLFLFFFIMILSSIFSSRAGWNDSAAKHNMWGYFVPDVAGLVCLIAAALYLGGV